MSNFDDLSPDELAAARFDSELPDDLVARVDADPELQALVAEQEAVANRLQAFTPPPLPAEDVKERHLAAAMAAFDELHGQAASNQSDSNEDEDDAATAAPTGAVVATTPRKQATSPTPPPASLDAARQRRRGPNPGVWIASAAAALLLVVAAVGLIAITNSDRSNDGSETAASDGAQESSDDGSGDDGSAADDGSGDDGGEGLASEEAPNQPTDTSDAAATAEASGEADADDEAMEEDDSSDAAMEEDDEAMEEADDEAMAEDDGGDEAMAEDGGSAAPEADAATADDDGEDVVGDDGDGPTSIALTDFFGREDLVRSSDVPTPCTEEIEARYRERYDGSVLINILDDPAAAEVTVFTFSTLDADNPEPIAAYAIFADDCTPVDEVLIAEPNR